MTFYYLSSSCLVGFLTASFSGWVKSIYYRKEIETTNRFVNLVFYGWPLILTFTIIHLIKGGK
jgi:hypothetical protein